MLVQVAGHGHVEESHHHFVVGLIAPAHRYIRVGIVRIVFRIVVPRHGLQHRAGFQRARLG